jgi:hypothetical protein
MMRRRVLLPTLGALVVVGVAPAAGQRPQDAGVAAALGGLWQRGDAGALVDLGAGTGLQLEIQGMMLGPLEGRRAAAALRQLFREHQTVDVRSGPLTRVAGSEDRGFVELDWWTRPAGGITVEHTTVFVGLVREPAGWRVSQIRVLP